MVLLTVLCFVSIFWTINSGYVQDKDNALHRHRPRRYLPPYPTPPLPAGVTRPTLGLMMFHVNFQYSRVPCADSPSRRTSLTEDQLMQLFVRKGGKFRPSLMAIDEERALSDFPNLLPIGQAKDTYIKNVDIPVSKEKLLDDLNKWDTFFKSAHKIPRPVLPDYSHHLQSAMNLLGSEVGNYIIKNGINPEDIINFINDHDIIHHPKILSSIRKPDRRWKRQSSGVNAQACQYRGNKTDNGFINFCTSCMTTTDLGSERFPRYINEIVCNVEPCLTVNRSPHGACQENILHLTFLRRTPSPNGCFLVIEDTSFGQNKTLAHAWETYTQRIRVGCSCKLDKRSRLKATFGFGK